MRAKISLGLLSVLWIMAASLVAYGASGASADDTKTRILYFSSFPEIMQPENKPGLAELATALRMEKAKNPNLLFIHGGASLGPSVFGAMDNGAHMIDILSGLNPDVMAIGKREFSYGYDNFILNALSASFPLVTSNLQDANTGGPIDATYPTYMLQSENLSVGFIALTSANAITEYGATQAQLLETIAATKTAARQLRQEGAHAVILLADTDYDDLSAVRADGTVDVIFYTHNFDNPQSLDRQGALLTEGALDGKIIAVDLWHEAGADGTTQLYSSAELLPLSAYQPDAEVSTTIRNYRTRLDQLLGPEIATVSKPFDTLRQNIRSKENAFANLITDAIRQAVSADIALLNGGTLRGNVTYAAGQKISRGDIQRELPFGGRTALVRMSGADIRNTLEHGIECGMQVDGCYTHVSNLRVTLDSRKVKGNRVISVVVDGSPLEPETLYRVATSDFMAGGNDGFEHLGKAEKIFNNGTNRIIWTIVVEHIERLGTIAPTLEGRMLDIAASQDTSSDTANGSGND